MASMWNITHSFIASISLIKRKQKKKEEKKREIRKRQKLIHSLNKQNGNDNDHEFRETKMSDPLHDQRPYGHMLHYIRIMIFFFSFH